MNAKQIIAELMANYSAAEVPKLETLEDDIALLLQKFGPDGHCDGADIIAKFVLELLKLRERSK